MLTGSIFLDLTIIFVAVAILAFFAKMFKQPLIPVYIITGILLVPVFNILHNDMVGFKSFFECLLVVCIKNVDVLFERFKRLLLIVVEFSVSYHNVQI